MTDHIAPEGGYGWVVVTASLFAFMMTGQLMASFPVMYREYMYAFDADAILVGTILSYNIILMDIAGFVFSGFLRYADLRVVAATGSLISGFSCFVASFSTSITMLGSCYAVTGAGCGVAFISISPVVHQYFCKKRTLVSGITIAGFSLGTFVFPQLARFATDFWGWRGALQLFAALVMQNVWLSALHRPLIARKTNLPTDKMENTTKWNLRCCTYLKSMVDLKTLKMPGYWLFIWSTFCTSLGCTGYMMHITNKCLSEGIDPYRAALAPSITGFANLIWRPLFGLIATKPALRNNTCVLYGVAGILMGVGIASVGAAHSFIYIFIAVVPVSMATGTLAIMFQPALVSLVGLDNMSRDLSFMMLSMGAGQFISAPFAAWLFQVSGTYTITYLVLGGISLVGGVASVIIGPVSKKFSKLLDNSPNQNNKDCKLTDNATHSDT